MAGTPVSGTEGYEEAADGLSAAVEQLDFRAVHGDVLALLPEAPAPVLDVGAGSGRDAAALAALGHDVLAVEPTGALRRRGMELHPSPRIAWLDDALPELARLAGHGRTFALIMMTAVWMHLDPAQRARALPRVAALLRPCGRLIMTLRHGPVPPGRRMFEVTGDETVSLAASLDLRLLLRLDRRPSALPRHEVTWTRLAFEKPDGT